MCYERSVNRICESKTQAAMPRGLRGARRPRLQRFGSPLPWMIFSIKKEVHTKHVRMYNWYTVFITLTTELERKSVCAQRIGWPSQEQCRWSFRLLQSYRASHTHSWKFCQHLSGDCTYRLAVGVPCRCRTQHLCWVHRRTYTGNWMARTWTELSLGVGNVRLSLKREFWDRSWAGSWWILVQQ